MTARVLPALLAAGLFAYAGLQMMFYSTFPELGLEEPVRAFGWFSLGMAALTLRFAQMRAASTP